MLYTAQRLVDKTRYWALDKTGAQQGNVWSDQEMLDALNEAQEGLVTRTILASQDHFGVYKDLAMAANQNIYPLYDGFLLMRKLDYLGGTDPTDVIESRMAEGIAGSGGIAAASESQYYYALYGEDLHLQPTPVDGSLGTIRQWFIRDPGPILLEIAPWPLNGREPRAQSALTAASTRAASAA